MAIRLLCYPPIRARPSATSSSSRAYPFRKIRLEEHEGAEVGVLITVQAVLVVGAAEARHLGAELLHHLAGGGASIRGVAGGFAAIRSAPCSS